MTRTDALRATIRRLHYSKRTEEAYVHWTRAFVRFHHRRHPREMGAAEVTAFLNDLAVRRHVATAPQNHVLCALLIPVPRAPRNRDARDRRFPTRATPRTSPGGPLSQRGVRLDQFEPPFRLLAELLYGTGLRLGGPSRCGRRTSTSNASNWCGTNGALESLPRGVAELRVRRFHDGRAATTFRALRRGCNLAQPGESAGTRDAPGDKTPRRPFQPTPTIQARPGRLQRTGCAAHGRKPRSTTPHNLPPPPRRARPRPKRPRLTTAAPPASLPCPPSAAVSARKPPPRASSPPRSVPGGTPPGPPTAAATAPGHPHRPPTASVSAPPAPPSPPTAAVGAHGAPPQPPGASTPPPVPPQRAWWRRPPRPR